MQDSIDDQWPTAPFLEASIDKTSLNETTNRTLTVTINHKGYQQNLYAHIIPITGTLTAADFGLSVLYKSFTATAFNSYETSTVQFEVAEDYTDETPDTETFRIEIKPLTSVSSTTIWSSDTISISDTSTELPFTLYNTSFSLPYDTNQGTSWLTSGTVTTTNGQAGTGRWLWIIDGVNGFRSDLQLNDFDFKNNFSNPSNNSSLDSVFSTTVYDASFVTASVDTDDEIIEEFATRTFSAIQLSTGSSRFNRLNSTPGSSGTGLYDGGQHFVYYESSGTQPSGGKACMLRSSEMTYTASPTISFSYALYSTVPSDVGRTRLFWIES